MLLKNKVAIISGVGNRFGKAAAYLFAKEGCNVVLISRNKEIIEDIALQINNKSGEAMSIVVDATDPESVKKAFDKIIEKYGHVDILLNNAGGSYTKKQLISEMDYEFWNTVIKNNVDSVFLMSKNFINHAQKKGASIINLACANKTLLEANGAYAMAKSGIIGLTKNVAREVRDKNIRVNCIMPGVIRKNFTEENIHNIPQSICRKGTSEDVAYAALFFASDSSSWITGQTLVVDGGEDLFLEMEKAE